MTIPAPTTNTPIVVALSGGVDSAAAAALLVEAGHRVIGITMRLYDARGTSESSGGRCCGPRDVEDARRVASHLGIPFYVADYEDAFRAAVIDDFVAEHLAGRTPNPCVRCNERIKFAPLLRRAAALGASHLATGHYARIATGADGRPDLRRARDASKDQSYFLFALPPDALARLCFPLGELTKDEVRVRARSLGLPNADKPESQEICFVPDGDHVGFVERAAGPAAPAAGELVDGDGQVLGIHPGVHRFTVGQRRGIGRSLGPEPAYVVSVDALTRKVTLGSRADAERVDAEVADVRWLGTPPTSTFRAKVQVRHRHAAVPATITPGAPTPSGAGRVQVRFDAPVWGVSPGQAAVVYDGESVLGGGWLT